ncbi:3010_t:CDS:1, partial [Cetraspora pellucida]
HFIDKDWNLKKILLAFRLVPVPYTGIAICSTFFKCLEDWDIVSKV